MLFVYRQDGKWGSVARSRDPGLHGRKPVFATPRALALSYVDPYVDFTGGVTGYAVADMREMGDYDWRFSRRYVWPAEQFLLDYPHRPIKTNAAHIADLRRRYRAFRQDARHEARGLQGAGEVDADTGGVQEGGRDCGSLVPIDACQSGTCTCAAPITQSRSKSLFGLEIGSCFACRSASSKPLGQVVAARLLALHGLLEDRLAARGLGRDDALRVVSSGLSPRSGWACEMMRPRLRSNTSIAPQQGHGTSTSDVRRDMPV